MRVPEFVDGVAPEVQDVDRSHQVDIVNIVDAGQVSGHRAQPTRDDGSPVASAQLLLHAMRRVDSNHRRVPES